MKPLRIQSAVEQVAEHLRKLVRAGALLCGDIPGVKRLAVELDVSHKTVEAALRRLEREGVIENPGVGRRRRVSSRVEDSGLRRLRIGMIHYERKDQASAHHVDLHHRLFEEGHRRIVLMVRQERRQPRPGAFERNFLGLLGGHGISTGPYHLPDRDDTPTGFRDCLDSLFQVTPPTALILDGAVLFTAAQQYLSRRGILAPERISLICTEHDLSFEWEEPPVSHMVWDIGPLLNRVVAWSRSVALGREDREGRTSPARFVEGGTIGPVPGSK